MIKAEAKMEWAMTNGAGEDRWARTNALGEVKPGWK